MSVEPHSKKTQSHFYYHYIPHVQSCSYIFWSWLLLNPNECSATSQVPNKTEPSSRSAAKAELDEHISITPCSWASSPLIVPTARRKSRHLVSIFKICFTELLHHFYHVMFIHVLQSTISVIFYHTPNATDLSKAPFNDSHSTNMQQGLHKTYLCLWCHMIWQHRINLARYSVILGPPSYHSILRGEHHPNKAHHHQSAALQRLNLLRIPCQLWKSWKLFQVLLPSLHIPRIQMSGVWQCLTWNNKSYNIIIYY